MTSPSPNEANGASAAHNGHDKSSTTALTVEVRSERSLFMFILQLIVRPFKPDLFKPRTTHDAESERLQAPSKVSKRCKIDERQADGLWIYDLSAKSETKSPKPDSADRQSRRIIYFAGGGWQMPANDNHWGTAAELVCRLPNTKLTLVSYPLAPKHPASIAFPKIAKLYTSLMAESTKANERVILVGDSAGGNIALCLATWSLSGPEYGGSEDAISAPAAVMGICPTVDLRHEHAGIKEVEKSDPILTHDSIKTTAQLWCGSDTDVSDATPDPHAFRLDWGPNDPRVSPARADLTQLIKNKVKIHGVTATYDVLGPESVDFREKCKRAGVQGEWLEWQKQMHCFPLTFQFGLREGKAAMNWIIDVLQRT